MLYWLLPVVVVVAVLLGMWVAFTITRLDRLHARVDAAGAALEAQLVRRAAAVRNAAKAPALPGSPRLEDELRAECELIAEQALNLPDESSESRETVENSVGRMLAQLADRSAALPPETVAELREAAARVQVARRFFNDAVRDTRAVRGRRMPRLLRLSGHREMPEFFDIDDTLYTDRSETVSSTSRSPAPGFPRERHDS